MEDGYNPPIRKEIITSCPVCGGDIKPKGGKSDPLNQTYHCENPDCICPPIDPTVPIYEEE